MTKEDLKQFIKNIKQPLSLFSFGMGFALVLVVAVGLFLMSGGFGSDVETKPQPSPTPVVTELPTGLEIEGSNLALPVVYVVNQGDSTWKIAQAFYGDGYKYLEIEAANQLQHDQWLEVGMELTIPKISGQSQKTEVPPVRGEVSLDNQVPADIYIVQENDSLWFISLKYLGPGARWTEIYELNKSTIGANPNLIYPGQKLRLPLEDLPGE